jgi:hypothetical protein
VDAALLMLPSRGWTGGLFGQRDRCLLVLSQLAGIPHKHLARLVAGDITVADGVAAITVAGQTRTVEAVDDPVLCGPCAIVRWLCTHQVIVTKIATRAIADHLRTADQLTSASPHVCREPLVLDDRSAGKPLLAPVNQWGHAPFPLSPMSSHAVSRQARDLLDGIIAVHRDLGVVPTADTPAPPTPQRGIVSTGYTQQQVRTAWDRRRSDLAELAGVADELADVDRQAAEIKPADQPAPDHGRRIVMTDTQTDLAAPPAAQIDATLDRGDRRSTRPCKPLGSQVRILPRHPKMAPDLALLRSRSGDTGRLDVRVGWTYSRLGGKRGSRAGVVPNVEVLLIDGPYEGKRRWEEVDDAGVPPEKIQVTEARSTTLPARNPIETMPLCTYKRLEQKDSWQYTCVASQ